MSIEDYRKLTGGETRIADLLAMPDAEDIPFEPPRATIASRAADSKP